MTLMEQLIALRQKTVKLAAAANDLETGLLGLVSTLDEMIKAAWPADRRQVPESLSPLLDSKADRK